MTDEQKKPHAEIIPEKANIPPIKESDNEELDNYGIGVIKYSAKSIPDSQSKKEIKSREGEIIDLDRLEKILEYFLSKDDLYRSTVLRGTDPKETFRKARARVEVEIRVIKDVKTPPPPVQIYIWVEIFAFLIFIITFGLAASNWPLALVVTGIFYYVGRYAIWKKPAIKNPK